MYRDNSTPGTGTGSAIVPVPFRGTLIPGTFIPGTLIPGTLPHHPVPVDISRPDYCYLAPVRYLALAILLCCTYTSALAVVTITGPSVVCEGSTITLSAPPGMLNYTWNTSATTQSITVWQGGRYSCKVTLPNGQVDSGWVDVTATARPRPHIGNPIEYLCEGDEANLKAPGYFASYRWNTGETTSSIQVTQAGRYSLAVTDSNGCTGQSDEVLVVVVPKPIVNVRGPNALCPGSSATYSNQAEVSTSYQWLVDGGSVVAGQGTAAAQITWTRSGTLRLRAVRTRPDGGTCVKDTLIVVRVSTKLKPEILYTLSSFCTGQSILLQAAPGYASYQWSTGETTPTIRVTRGGYYWLSVTDSSGCSGTSDSLLVREFPLPEVNIVAPSSICEGAWVDLVAQSKDNNVVLWDWNTGHRGHTLRVNQAGTYQVVGRTIDNCADTAFVVLSLSPPIAATADDVNVGVVPTGYQFQSSVIVRNTGVNNVSVTNVVGLPANAISPALPRLVPAGSSQTFTIRYTPPTPGPFSVVLQWELMSADCLDTITSTVTGIATGDPPQGSISFRIPDTTVLVGETIRLPVTITLNVPSGPTEASLVFSVRFPVNAFHLHHVENARLDANDVSDADRILTVRVGNDVLTYHHVWTVNLVGQAMLRQPFTAPVNPGNASIENGPLVIFDYDAGSLATTGCYLPGRLVNFNGLSATLTIHSLQGELLHTSYHTSVTSNTMSEAVGQLRIPQQPIVIRLLDNVGTVIYSRVTIAQP